MRLTSPPALLLLSFVFVVRSAPGQNTNWFNFENRTRLAIAPQPGGGVIAFGGDRGSLTSLLDDTWGLGGGWGLLNPGAGPSSRSGHALGFHSGSGPTPPRTVLFGGSTSATAVSAQTWVYNGNNWSLLVPAANVPPRSGHAMASDVGRNVVLMFGGSGIASNLNDTWEWDGTNWLLRGVGGPRPASRSGHAMAWNESTGRVLMFGGNPALSETWEFDSAADTWVQLITAPGNTPPGRTATALAYDRFNRNVVLFGGRDAGGNALNDTWVWDPSVAPNGGWVLRVPGFNPPARSGHAMTFDAAAQRVIMVGGSDSSGASLDNTYEWNGATWRARTAQPTQPGPIPMAWDIHRKVAVLCGVATWELTGSGWVHRTDVVSPNPRVVHSTAYDSLRRRMVIFGGTQLNGSVYLDDTWEFDGSIWLRRLTATTPPGLSSANMAFDLARGQIVLFGGQDASGTKRVDTWTYDGIDWTLRSPSNFPRGRSGHGMAYDQRRGRVVLFGGATFAFSSFENDTWEWDGSNWSEVPVPVPQRPSARGTYMTYDEARGRVVLFGGYDGSGSLGDTWEWDGANWLPRFPLTSPTPYSFAAVAYGDDDEVVHAWANRLRGSIFVGETWYHQSLRPARYRTRGAQNQILGPGCPGSFGTPSLRTGVGERPWLGDSFTVYVTNVPTSPVAALGMGGSQIAPIPLGPIGMGSCLLHTNPVVFLPVSVLGTVTFTVPNDPGLVQGRFFHQAFVFDPPANHLGLTASDLAEATMGVR